MKTENLLRILNLRIAKNYFPGRSVVYEGIDTQTIIDAMQDNADQAIAEYKRKLKELVSGKHAILTGDLIELMDNTI